MQRNFYHTLLLAMAITAFSAGDAVSQIVREIPMERALKLLREKYNVQFLYESVQIEGKFLTADSIIYTDSAEETIRRVLHSLDLSYEIVGRNTYVLTTSGQEVPVYTSIPASSESKSISTAELAASTLTASIFPLYSGKEKNAVDLTITGRVVSKEDREPLPGVSILVKGTMIGTVSASDGTYLIEVPDVNAILIYSFIGYQSQEVSVSGKEVIDIVLESDIRTLDEVVVTAIGIESNKRQLAYSIQNVNTEEVVRARETNLVAALSGKIAGVQVTSSSGSPGASAAIRIRGNKSFRGNNAPLFVVDGVPIDNNLSGNSDAGVDVSNRAVDLNALDIESMSVLKGPQATALYGIRAANGAVVITTKRGKKGGPVITLSSSYSRDEVNKLPPRQSRFAQGRPTGGVVTYRGPELGETNSWGPRISDLEFSNETDYPYDKNGRLVAQGSGGGVAARAYDPYESFFVYGNTLDNNLSVSGGSDAVKYYISSGKLYQTGIAPNQDFQRLSFKANIEADISPRVSVGASATFVNSGGSRIQRGSNVSGVMTGILRNATTFDIGNGKKGHTAANDPTTYLQENAEQRTMAFSSSSNNAAYDNPFFTINRNPWKDDVNRFLGNLSFSYKVLPWVTARYKIGADHYTDRRNSAYDINSSSEIYGSVSQSVRTNTDLNSDFMLLAERDLLPGLEFNGTLGHNYFSQYFNTQSATGTGLSVSGFYNIDNASTIQSSQTFNRRKVFGLFGDIKMIYKDFLILNLSGRNDWSSTLPQKNNSFFYPSASLGLVLTDLIDFKSKLFSYGKLRASLGQSGNDAPAFRTDTYYVPADIDGDDIIGGNTFPAFGTTAFEKSSVQGNPNLKAELTTSYEVGGDFKLLEGRLGLDVTYYSAKTNDQVVTIIISATSGSNQFVTNAGTMVNKGWEFALNGKPVESKNFQWDINLNFTRNRNRVLDVPGEVDDLTISSFSAVSSRIIEGQPFGILSGTRYKRDASGELIINVDGWPVIDDQQGIIGDPNPDWIAGITNTLTYKSLSVSFLWDIRKGGDLWNGTRGVMNYLGVSKESGEQREIRNFVFDGVTEDGQVNTTPVDFANPADGLTGIRWRRAGTLLGIAEDVIEDGSWVRLRNVSLSWHIPSFKLASLFSNVTFTLYGKNLLLFTKYTGVDPETNLRGAGNDMGWDYFNLPNTKSYGATLQFTFK
jgi:TonB-linked SusC/RagA family outer membrane protein